MGKSLSQLFDDDFKSHANGGGNSGNDRALIKVGSNVIQ
jgi:hypothetical protein